jgi:hypothetical protein
MGTVAVGYAYESNVDRLTAGVVTVAHRIPRCTCGWMGRRRRAQFMARHDAWMHAAATGCYPGVPLVMAR